jgi:hypothetical protein
MTQHEIETKAKVAALAQKIAERDIGTKPGADGANYGRT